jgi:hypothetical protein
MAQDQGEPDGASRSAAPSPTANLIPLAAAGRDPADITIPTVGSEGTGRNRAPAPAVRDRAPAATGMPFTPAARAPAPTLPA